MKGRERAISIFDRYQQHFEMEASATSPSLVEEFRKLLHKRDLVMSRVKEAKEKNETINSAVWEWLDEVGKLIEEMNTGRKKGVIALPVAYNYFNSMKEASQELLKALQNDTYYTIGLSGKRDSGKTALVKSEINKYEKLFSRVIFLNMFKKDMKSMHVEIANSLNLHFEFERDDYDPKLKGKIWTNCKIKEEIKSEIDREDVTTLVILDNFPAAYYLEDLGIPDQCTQCKVLLITDIETDCTWHCGFIEQKQSECDCLILLKPISNDEAWELLQNLRGIDSRSGLFNVAREVAFRCKGLPGLINDVASSLENKNTMEYWTETLDNVRHSTACYQIFVSMNIGCVDLTDALCDALGQEGLKVFSRRNIMNFDKEKQLAAVDEAIEQSRCSIIVFSHDYAAHNSHLRELVKIVKSKEETKQLVLPIFYKVEPSDVRYVRRIEKIFQLSKKKEAAALNEVVSLPGKEYIRGSQSDFIQEIIQYLQNNNKHQLHIKHSNGQQGRLCSYDKYCTGEF